MCVCVCVCEREREREILFKHGTRHMYYDYLQSGVGVRVVGCLHNKYQECACVRTCVCVRACVYVRAACVRVCVCVRACVSACVRVRV